MIIFRPKHLNSLIFRPNHLYSLIFRPKHLYSLIFRPKHTHFTPFLYQTTSFISFFPPQIPFFLTFFQINHLFIPQSLVLLEDIDAAFPNRDRDFTAGSAGFNDTNDVTFSGLLNVLDGVASSEERLVFMTTNYIHRYVIQTIHHAFCTPYTPLYTPIPYTLPRP